MKDRQVTRVIFRKWPQSQGGDVIALFPALAGTNSVQTCLSYQTMGQHSAATIHLGRDLRLASPAEYAPLAAELRRLGYRLKIVRRATAADRRERERQLAPVRATYIEPDAKGGERITNL